MSARERALLNGITAQPVRADYVSAMPSAVPVSCSFLVTHLALHEYEGVLRYHVYEFMGWNAQAKKPRSLALDRVRQGTELRRRLLRPLPHAAAALPSKTCSAAYCNNMIVFPSLISPEATFAMALAKGISRNAISSSPDPAAHPPARPHHLVA